MSLNSLTRKKQKKEEIVTGQSIIRKIAIDYFVGVSFDGQQYQWQPYYINFVKFSAYVKRGIPCQT